LEPVACPAIDDLEPGVTATCDCTYYGDPGYGNAICDGQTQLAGKAYPSIRQLQVLRDFGANSIVTSICPKQMSDPGASDFGHRPAMITIADRLHESLSPR
jgi:hypothetical protein